MSGHRSFDPTYHQRVGGRNEAKTAAILRALPRVQSALDVGCNAGYISRALLDAGAGTVHGLELDTAAVDPDLRARPGFTLHVGDVATWTPPQAYDAVVYCAVHHHVAGVHGMDAALATWGRLLAHARQYLIFETGLLAEPGGWYWQGPIRERFGTDAAHLEHLLAAAGARLRWYREIARLPINGAGRPIYLLELLPP